MRIRWQRIIGLILLGIFLYLFCKLQPFLRNLLETVNQDYGYERPIKIIMLGVLCLTFIAGLKLIFRR